MLLSLLIGIFLTISGYLEKIDRFNTDTYHVLSGVRHQPKATVIASLDAESLQFYHDTPLVFWGPHFAKAIDRLREAGAAAIALDIYFAITPEQWLRTLGEIEGIPTKILDYDQTFDQALSEGRVILSADPIYKKDKIPVPLPADEYLAALPNHLGGVGLTTLQIDSDSRIRWMVPAFEGLPTDRKNGNYQPLAENYKAPNPWWTLAALAVKEAFGEAALVSFQGEAAYSSVRINYCGPPMTIPRISLVSLFREQGLTSKERSLIAGRIVFIGADHESLGDHHSTPYSEDLLWLGYPDMTGVEIQANIAETILNPQRIQVVPLVVVFSLWALILALIAFLCIHDIKPTAKHVIESASDVIEFASVLIYWAAGLILFRHGYLLPQAGLFSSITLFFLVKKILQAVGTDKRCRSIIIHIIGKTAFDKVYI
jgi:adenylate cyclase